MVDDDDDDDEGCSGGGGGGGDFGYTLMDGLVTGGAVVVVAVYSFFRSEKTGLLIAKFSVTFITTS